MTESRARTLCVLTAGRSGSSLATQVIGLLGLELGPERDMLPATAFNERGYWELREIMDLNDEILETLGGSFWHPPVPPAGWEHDATLEPLTRRARELVDRVRPADRSWAFKDPRTVYTLPLWRTVVGDMDYLICTRDPDESIASLSRVKVDFTRDELAGLWIGANCAALRGTSGRRRLIVRYDEWFTEPEAAVARLATFVGVDADEETVATVRAAIEPSLHHERARDVSADASDLPVEARVLDMAMRRLAVGDDPGLELFAHGLDTAYEHRMARERAGVGALRTEATELRAELERTSERQATLESDIRRLTERLDRREA